MIVWLSNDLSDNKSDMPNPEVYYNWRIAFLWSKENRTQRTFGALIQIVVYKMHIALSIYVFIPSYKTFIG